MQRDSFIFYRSFYEAILELPGNDQKDVLLAIANYSLNFQEPELTGLSKAVWILIKPQLDANNQRYKNGAKGGRPKTEKKPKRNQNETKVKANKNVNVNVNDNTVESIDFDGLLLTINQTFGREFKVVNKGVRAKYHARLKDGYTRSDIMNAILNCKNSTYHTDTNYQYCTPEFFSRSSTLDKYSSTNPPKKEVKVVEHWNANLPTGL